MKNRTRKQKGGTGGWGVFLMGTIFGAGMKTVLGMKKSQSSTQSGGKKRGKKGGKRTRKLKRTKKRKQ
jgi:hypothetical protein